MKKKARYYEPVASKIYFVSCELEYYGRKQGLLRLLSGIGCIEGVLQTQLDGKGNILVTGEFDPDYLLAMVGDNVRIKRLQKAKCFSVLYPPEPAKKESKSVNNNNNRAYNHPNLYDPNACCGGACEYYGAPYNAHYGENGYQNYYSQPRKFGDPKLLQEQTRDPKLLQEQTPEVAQVKKTSPLANCQESPEKSRRSKSVGGCCLM